MSGERPKPLDVHHSDFALLLASAATERTAIDERMQEAARIIDGLEGPLLRSFARGCAEQHWANVEAETRLARAFEALASESGTTKEPDTRRDVAVRKRDILTTLRIVCLSLAGGLGAAGGAVGLATAWPKLALVLGGLGAFFGGCAITLPLPKP